MAYIHAAWVQEAVFLEDRFGKQRIQRYLAKMPPSFDEVDQVFPAHFTEIDRIVAFEDGLYLVKWQSLPYSEATWEEPSLVNDDDKIAEFRARERLPSERELAAWRAPTQRPPLESFVELAESPVFKGGHSLRPYQLHGLNWLRKCWYSRRNSILADEMGLGKTIQTISIINNLFERERIPGPFLIVVPLSTISHWRREFEGWTHMNTIVYHGDTVSREILRAREIFHTPSAVVNEGRCSQSAVSAVVAAMGGVPKFHVLITTYEMVLCDTSFLSRFAWRYLCIDEAHRLKNKTCRLTTVMRQFKYDHLLLLSGTPLQNNIEELWTLLNVIDPSTFASLSSFMQDFGDLKDLEQVERLQNLLKPYMLRRMKEDVEKSIAPKEETIVEVELTKLQKQYYRAIYDHNLTFLTQGVKASNIPSLRNIMMQLRKCCNHPFLIKGVEDTVTQGLEADDAFARLINASGKMVLIDKLLPKLKARGHKVLIFSQMVRMLDILEDYMHHRNYVYERIDGGVRGNDRQSAIDRFSRDGSDRFVFLLCTRAGGLGINLTAADTVIIFDSDWNPQNDLQAQARCHRIGQTQMVKIYRLITKNTYEKLMFDRASLKLGLDQAVLTKLNTNKTASSSSSSDLAAADDSDPMRALSKQEVDKLLKYGAYCAFADPANDTEPEAYDEDDIDRILERTQFVPQTQASTAAVDPTSTSTSTTDTSSSAVSSTDANSRSKVASFASADAGMCYHLHYHYYLIDTSEIVLFNSLM